MAKGTTVSTSLVYVVRLTNSTNGNPRFRLATMNGEYQTQSDAACSYDVANLERRIPHGGTLPVILSLTPAGRVWAIVERDNA